MGISLKPEHVKRYRDIAKLLFKYGRSDLVNTAGLDDALLPEDSAVTEGSGPRPEELADDLERMGPTFIKLGQLLSTRPDLLPQPYIDALTRLQDNVGPFPGEEAERIVGEELGVRVGKAFAEFERSLIRERSAAGLAAAGAAGGPVGLAVNLLASP